jgi:uncharacterized protein (DUF2252 family)
MLASPLAFYRGAAAVMAADLARVPATDLRAQLCGDAHLTNFGGFASPERDFVFDVNDFDETLSGPFEWDVKRLAASFEIAGRELDLATRDRRSIVRDCVRAYRTTMLRFAGLTNLEIWYARLDVVDLEGRLRKAGGRKDRAQLEQSADKARTRDSLKAFAQLTEIVDGQPRIASDPPLVVPIRDLEPGSVVGADEIEAAIRELFRRYRHSLPRDRRALVERYRYVDLARKVVGVGSVGTRCWIVLLLGNDERDPLFLQIKEASPSVLEAALGRSQFANRGQRVVEGQRLMQAASDIFLGWVRSDRELDGVERDFYVRQLWDWKYSINVERESRRLLALHAKACGWTLARAHARSGERVAIAAYLGKGDAFDAAVSSFAKLYADVNERDLAALGEAVRTGRVEAEEGV